MTVGPVKLGVLDLLLVFVPISVVLELAHAGPVARFATTCIAIVPLAGWMGRATEHLAEHFGAGVGGLLNATFGNAAELIIAITALREGLHDLVKASLTGSIIGNVLLVLGLSLLAGGLRHRKQTFNPTAAGLAATMLTLSAIGLVVPAIFHELAKDAGAPHEQGLSLAIAIVLFLAYGLSLVFSLKTHRHLFGGPAPTGAAHAAPAWSKRRSALVLLAATALVALMSEFLVGSVGGGADALGMTEVFVGVVLVAIIGNAAEHSTAILVALRNKMDLSIGIAAGSGIQIALFVAPLLVFLSYGLSPAGPMDLLFTPFEVAAVVLSVIIVDQVAKDGASHWMEGVMLLAVYVIIALAFYFLPEAVGPCLRHRPIPLAIGGLLAAAGAGTWVVQGPPGRITGAGLLAAGVLAVVLALVWPADRRPPRRESDDIGELDDARRRELIRGTSLFLREMEYRYSIRIDARLATDHRPFAAEVNGIRLGFIPAIITDTTTDRQGYGFVAFVHDGNRWRGPGLPCPADQTEAVRHAARCVSPLATEEETKFEGGKD